MTDNRTTHFPAEVLWAQFPDGSAYQLVIHETDPGEGICRDLIHRKTPECWLYLC